MTARDAAPYWARWKARQVEVRPWASLRLSAQYGHRPVQLLSVGRGWVSVRVEYPTGPRCEVYRPGDLDWSEARVMGGCTGVQVETAEGAVHELNIRASGEGRLWQWVRRAVQTGASVEGLF